MPYRRRSRQKGIALLLCLWATALLAVWAAGMMRETLMASHEVDALAGRISTETAADGAVSLSALDLLPQAGSKLSTLLNVERNVQIAGKPVRISISDESERIPIGAVTEMCISKLRERLDFGDDVELALRKARQEYAGLASSKSQNLLSVYGVGDFLFFVSNSPKAYIAMSRLLGKDFIKRDDFAMSDEDSAGISSRCDAHASSGSIRTAGQDRSAAGVTFHIEVLVPVSDEMVSTSISILQLTGDSRAYANLMDRVVIWGK